MSLKRHLFLPLAAAKSVGAEDTLGAMRLGGGGTEMRWGNAPPLSAHSAIGSDYLARRPECFNVWGLYALAEVLCFTEIGRPGERGGRFATGVGQWGTLENRALAWGEHNSGCY